MFATNTLTLEKYFYNSTQRPPIEERSSKAYLYPRFLKWQSSVFLNVSTVWLFTTVSGRPFHSSMTLHKNVSGCLNVSMAKWLLKFKFVTPQTSTWETKIMTILNIIIKSLENLNYFNQISTQPSSLEWGEAQLFFTFHNMTNSYLEPST